MAKERERASRRWALSPREGVQGKSEPRLIKQPILFMKEPPQLVVRMDPSLPKGFHKKTTDTCGGHCHHLAYNCRPQGRRKCQEL